MTRGERQKLFLGLAFISPWIVGFLMFTLYPVVASMFYSFCDYDVLTRPVWIGTLNYSDMFTDSVFWKSLYNTLFFAVIALPLGLITSLLVAVLLNQPVKGRSLFRAIFFLPSLIPVVATSMIWLWILNGNFGLLNHGLKCLGINHPPQWLADPSWTKPSLILMSVWGVGNSIVIYLAALQDVPRSLYESADLDGATAWKKLRYITLPMISPVIYFNLIMGIIGSLQVFAQAYIMLGGGGPNRSALFYAVYLYQNAFEYRQMGYACAMAWVLFLVILFLTWVATKSTRRLIYYAGE
ncbi:MAG: sugar ABC transporter permease [Kiritimatiellia bacterium]|jgi:multiple sugar transport system permease protein|nr:sugar ABC transporter permease [Kiritimatiellia bacterium]MDP6847952.1 sugar ABC transporter permease [Kiritimatiellia bacterium]